MKRTMPLLFVAALLALAALPARAAAQSISGLWDATVVVNGGIEVPFRFEIAGSGTADQRVVLQRRREGDVDHRHRSRTARSSLSFDEYGTKLEATLKDGRLEGQYSRGTRGAPYPFQAKRFAPAPGRRRARSRRSPGLWNVQVGKSSKGEAAWQLIVRQSGAEASAAILRVDGDTGTLTGTYRDGKFVLSHFSGARPLRLELTPAADGTLSVVQNKDNPLTAVRADAGARRRVCRKPSDPSRFTSVKDPTEPFRFSFPDLERPASFRTPMRSSAARSSSSASRGSWCPNCHDEAPFLGELYKKYRKQGTRDRRACRSRKKRS